MAEWHAIVEIEGEDVREEDFCMPDRMDAEEVAEDVVRCLWEKEQMDGDATDERWSDLKLRVELSKRSGDKWIPMGVYSVVSEITVVFSVSELTAP